MFPLDELKHVVHKNRYFTSITTDGRFEQDSQLNPLYILYESFDNPYIIYHLCTIDNKMLSNSVIDVLVCLLLNTQLNVPYFNVS